MRFTFDPGKDATNREKHGVSLAVAANLEWDRMLIEIDDRFDYGETRLVGFAPRGERIYCIVFTLRGDACHVISLRKANRREVNRYEAQVHSSG